MNGAPFVDDPAALVIVDWSLWLNKSFRLFELDGMVSGVVGWLCGLLAWRPAHVCLALDPPGITFRHRMIHPTDPTWRYKGHREPKPEEFWKLGERCTEIAALHRIPAIWADGYEADDVIATVAARARAAGYRVWIVSGDKDLLGLVEPDVCLLDGHSWEVTDERRVWQRLKVKPSQVADALAISGDASDSVPGVPGLGLDRAAQILAAYGTLENALTAPDVDPEAITGEIKRLARDLRKAIDPEARDKIGAVRGQLLARRAVARYRRTLVAHEGLVRFSRQLTALDCGAPVDVPWDELPIGGYDVARLRARYESLGYTRKAAEVETFRKGLPWAYP